VSTSTRQSWYFRHNARDDKTGISFQCRRA